MFMSLIIHMLEVCVAVLCATLGWQVARQYKLQVDAMVEDTPSGSSLASRRDMPAELFAAASPQGAPKAASRSEKRKEPYLGTSVLDRAEKAEAGHGAQESAAKTEQTNSALDILDDYIGGFFEAPGKSEVEMKAFRAVDEQEVESYYHSDAGNDHISAIAPAIDLTKYKASTADSADQIPVLRTPIPESLITERFLEQMKELDEEVILVEEKQQVVSRDSVMSDKVVLAMLDEAKLVGTN